MRPDLSRRGLTLVEVLLVIGILSLIGALIAPAVLKVREAASKYTCASNLRQLGTAAHNYHAARRKLPPGYFGPAIGRETDYPSHLWQGQWIGHFPLLLPHLEEESSYAQLRVNLFTHVVTPLPWFWKPGPVSHAENYTAGMHKMPEFRCPSAADYLPQAGAWGPGTGGTLVGLHVFNSPERGAFTDGWLDNYILAAPYQFLGRTNYIGVAGCGTGTHQTFSRYAGIYTNRSNHSLEQIAALDGTSHTLLYGETCGTQWNSQPYSTDIAWMAGGGLGTYLGLQRARTAPIITFSSWHTAGVQFCFADGSVRTIRFGDIRGADATPLAPSPDWYLLQQLAGYKDGQSGDVSSLLE